MKRPVFHFTPPRGWLNDPNGLIFFQDEYHLFYQYYPHDQVWGPMHWGHAVSRDLMQWDHLPIALFPDESGYIFSGSAVVDVHNTAGFGHNALVAIYTAHQHELDPPQQGQSIAYSVDNGRSWTKYDGNPVIQPHPDIPDFRDPKVFWYGTAADGEWVMVLAVAQEMWFFTSPDLIHWTKRSTFGQGVGSHDGVWECPDLFPLTVSNEAGVTKWVLIGSVGDGAPAGGSGVQYFVGTFDGRTFTADVSQPPVCWLDYGPDFYAGATWVTPDGRLILLGWLNNWPYARVIPATTWRGMMSVPRELTLVRSATGYYLRQRPLTALTSHAACSPLLTDTRPLLIAGDHPLEVQPLAAVIELTFKRLADRPMPARFGIQIHLDGESGRHGTTIGYDVEQARLFIDRSRMGHLPPEMADTTLITAPWAWSEEHFQLRLVLDHQSVELFAGDGQLVMSALLFPAENGAGLALFAHGGAISLERGQIQLIQPAEAAV